MRSVGIVGRKRAGKDTAAQVLISEHGYTRVGFADALKALALKADPNIGTWDAEPLSYLVERLGWERAKDYRDEVREFLQTLGTGAREILGPDIWVNAWALAVEAASGAVVVPDVRFENEAAHLRALGFVLVRVERPGLDTSDTHVSEVESDGISAHCVMNDGDVGLLRARVRNLAREFLS